MNRSVAGVLVALVVALAAIGLLTAKEEKALEPTGGEPPAEKLSVERVARRVERIRELRFEGLPRLQRVSADQARAAVLTELDRNVARSEQEAGERLLKLLGLLPTEASLRETLARATASEVGGYYVPRTDTLALVRDAGLEGVLGEVALAHELVHALEDQRFGLEPGGGMLWRDRATARSGLAEGTATLAMVDYLAQSQGAGDELPAELRERVLEQIGELTIPATGGLPRYVRESLVFPYAAGAALVNRIQSEGGWAAVDKAYGDRPVLSSEQLIHPEKYDSNEKPVTVRLPDLGELLPEGAAELTRGDLGEFDTEQFLREGNGRERSERAAAGWGGSA
ncbi:MAG TPA: hypothetical protein VES62_17590, partial [Thermoleophilaceae bacterium]|nr:hypothetical protein [Thermoleophilaceae bacterium]